MDAYGKELILDLRDCEPVAFTRESIEQFFIELCKEIDMERGPLYWWDDLHTPKGEEETEPHLVGTSAVQFITTSNITIHTLTLLRAVYLNIFSCKSFDAIVAAKFAEDWFLGKISRHTVVMRGTP